MKATRHPFSLVEILLALGVVCIGICSVMVLFPVGVSANRDASMETYAAQAADQLLHYLEYKIETYSPAVNPLVQLAAEYNVNSSKPSIPSDLTQQLDDASEDPDNPGTPNSWMQISDQPQIFRYRGTSVFQFISVKEFSNSMNVNSADIDYRGLLRVWVSDVQSSSTPDFAGNTHVSAIIHVLASWPAQLPESQQQSEEFTLFVSKSF